MTQKESQQRYRLILLAERYFCSECPNTYPMRTVIHTIWRWNYGPSCSCGSTQLALPAIMPIRQCSPLSRKTTPQPRAFPKHAHGSGRTTAHTPCRIQGCSWLPPMLYQCPWRGLFSGRLGLSLRGSGGTFEDRSVVLGRWRVIWVSGCWSWRWRLSGDAFGLVQQFSAFDYGEALGSFDDIDDEGRTLGSGLTLRHDIYIYKWRDTVKAHIASICSDMQSSILFNLIHYSM